MFFYNSIFWFSLIFSSCEIYNPDEDIPSYIRIEKTDLVVDSPLVYGSASHKITDAWVFVDENLAGVYELPVTFPLLYEGRHTIKVRAGIKVNGITSTRAPYDFYSAYSEDITLKRGQKIKLDPVVKYSPTADFALTEDFESPGIKFTVSGMSDTSLQLTSDPNEVFEGKVSGKAILSGSHDFFEISSSSQFALPKNSPVYLEINYKCNQVFAAGIYAYTSGGNQEQITSLFVNPSASWNKIYINLSEQINSAIGASSYRIFIGFVKEDAVSQPVLYLDNIKVVY